MVSGGWVRGRAVAGLAMVVILAVACAGGAAAPTTGKLRVAASIPPLGDMVRQVGGEWVEVQVLVPPGASVHTYEPTPAQVEFLAKAPMLVLNGVGLEFWAKDVVDAAGNKKLLVVDTSKGIEIIAGDEHEGSGNPHIWLDPLNAMVQVEHIRDGLIEIDPEHRAYYEDNAVAFRAKLEALDAEIRAEVATWRAKDFVAFHNAYVYLARRYGLNQAAVIEEFPGKEPNPQELARVVEVARGLPTRAIFAEPQLSPKVAQVLAQEAGKEVLMLDPEGGVAGRATYLELMRYNLQEMAQALK